MDRYRQILLPTLRLFEVILTSTTMNHQQGATQVIAQLMELQSELYNDNFFLCILILPLKAWISVLSLINDIASWIKLAGVNLIDTLCEAG